MLCGGGVPRLVGASFATQAFVRVERLPKALLWGELDGSRLLQQFFHRRILCCMRGQRGLTLSVPTVLLCQALNLYNNRKMVLRIACIQDKNFASRVIVRGVVRTMQPRAAHELDARTRRTNSTHELDARTQCDISICNNEHMPRHPPR